MRTGGQMLPDLGPTETTACRRTVTYFDHPQYINNGLKAWDDDMSLKMCRRESEALTETDQLEDPALPNRPGRSYLAQARS